MFNREAKLKNIKTLEELNRLWAVFLDAYYHQKPMKGSANTTKALVRQSRNQGSLPFRNGTVTAVP